MEGATMTKRPISPHLRGLLDKYKRDNPDASLESSVKALGEIDDCFRNQTYLRTGWNPNNKMWTRYCTYHLPESLCEGVTCGNKGQLIEIERDGGFYNSFKMKYFKCKW